MRFRNRTPRNPQGAKAVLILIISLISISVVYHFVTAPPRKHFVPHHWSSEISGWYNRSTIVQDTSHIHFTSLLDFQLIHTTSSRGSEALQVAFFDGDYCITRTAVLKLQHQDFVEITDLIAIARARNEAQRYYSMNTIIHDIATYSIHIVGSDDHLKLYSAYGFRRNGADSGASWMPEELWQLFGLVAREEIGGLESEGENFKRLKEELGGLVRAMKNVGKHYGPAMDN